MAEGTCSVEGCDREVRYVSKGWCNQHYQSWYRYGDPLAAPGRRQPSVCKIDGCDGAHKGHGYCMKHLVRFRKYGDASRTEKPRAWLGKTGEESGSWKDREIGYGAAHIRVVTERGSASSHDCVRCGSVARDWAYDHGDPDELTDPRGLPYSPDIDHYLPMCRSCHRRWDHEVRCGNRVELQ